MSSRVPIEMDEMYPSHLESEMVHLEMESHLINLLRTAYERDLVRIRQIPGKKKQQQHLVNGLKICEELHTVIRNKQVILRGSVHQ